MECKYIVRHYDVFDEEWIDITGPLSKSEATNKYNELTKNGTEYASYEDLCYYKIFPFDTVMYLSEKNKVRH